MFKNLFSRKKKYWITPEKTIYTLYKEMAQETHLLIAGSTGSGKSCAMTGIIDTLLTMYNPTSCQFILIDPKLTELNIYKNLPHVITYAARNDEITAALKQTIAIMENRLEEMQKRQLKKFDGSNIYVIIDELAHIMLTQKRTCKPLLQQILQLARAANIHVFACTQVTLATVIPTEIRINFTGIVGLKVPNKKDSTFINSIPGAELFPNPAIDKKAFCFFRRGCMLEKYELPYITDEKAQETINYWQDRKRCTC